MPAVDHPSSFLISSPMVDLGSLVLLMSIFGAKIAVLYVVLGLVIAVVGGTLLEKMGMERYVEDFIKNAPHIEAEGQELTRQDRVQFAKEQLLGTIKKVAPYIFVGVAIGAFIHNVVPQEWVETILGSNNPFAVVLATLVGVPMYADIFGTIPVAESLLYKGAGLGTILSFMMAVTTLSLPSLVMLKKAVKPKLLAAFIAICFAGASGCMGGSSDNDEVHRAWFWRQGGFDWFCFGLCRCRAAVRCISHCRYDAEKRQFTVQCLSVYWRMVNHKNSHVDL